MMKKQTILRSLGLMILLASASCMSKEPAPKQYVSVCYIPLNVDTYVPMTLSNFSKSCTELGTIATSDPRYRRLDRAVKEKAGHGTFNELGYRVRLVYLDAATVYIDHHGVVDSGGVLSQMSHRSLLEVASILDPLEQQSGM
jgi:hypothetical protein